MKKRKIILEIIFFVVVTGLTTYYLYASGVFTHIGDLRNVTAGGLILVISAALGYMLCDAFIIWRNMRAIGKNVHYVDGIGTYMMGNLGSSVTPWKSAHFPMLAYYLNKRGFHAEEIVSVLASDQIIYSITLPFLYGGIMIYALVNHSEVLIGDKTIPLYLISLIGVVTNIGYFAGLMLLLYNEKFQKFIRSIEFKVLKKLKRIKNDEEWLTEKETKMRIYKETSERIFHHFLYYLPSILVYVLFMFLCFGLPYFCYLALSHDSFSIKDYLSCFMLCQAMSYVTNIVPVPGGMVAAEFSFMTVYETFMGSFVNMAVLLYRFFTYIMFIILDFLFFIGFEIYLHVKDKRIEKKDSIV